MSHSRPSYLAGEDLGPSLFVKHEAGVDNTVVLCVADDVAIGVTHEGTREAPIPSVSTPLAAAEGESCQIYGADEPCEIVAGSAIQAGDRLKPDADSKAVPAADHEPASAVARTDAASGEKVKVMITTLPGATGLIEEVVAAGSTQADAAELTANATNTVSGADGTKGVVLPAAVAGTEVKVYNEHATNGLKVYPASGDDINDGTTDAAITIEGKTFATFVALDGTTWAATYTADT